MQYTRRDMRHSAEVNGKTIYAASEQELKEKIAALSSNGKTEDSESLRGIQEEFMKEVKVNKRSWLNKREDMTGSIAMSLEVEKVPSGKYWVWSSLEIRDCRRSITLDFDLNGEENKENSLHKIRVIREYLDELEGFINEVNVSEVD